MWFIILADNVNICPRIPFAFVQISSTPTLSCPELIYHGLQLAREDSLLIADVAYRTSAFASCFLSLQQY